ncbi:MAG TPA: hypothetical protein VEF06_07350 [Bryobacteraceae bacterium]|nr:hypothetical protein [Bryobacteraceae bacterium]
MRANHWIAKAVLLAVALFVVSFASAQTVATPNLVMAPTPAADLNDPFVPGAAPFVLMIKATNNQTTSYRFTVVATLENGSTKVVTGEAIRSDNNAGYTAAPVTLGVNAVSVSATVNEQ